MAFTIKKNVKGSNENDELENTQPIKVRSIRKKVVKVEATNNNEEQLDTVIQSEDINNGNVKSNRPHDILYISKLSALTFEELLDFAESYGIKKDSNNNIRRQELMHAIVRAQHSMNGKIVSKVPSATILPFIEC